MSKMSVLGGKLVELRGKQSQRIVAKATGLSVAQISLLERGVAKRLLEENVRKLCEYYGVDFEKLMEGTCHFEFGGKWW